MNSTIFDLDDLRSSDDGWTEHTATLSEAVHVPRHTLVSIISGHSADDIQIRTSELSALARTDLDRRMLAVNVAVQGASETERKVSPAIRLDLWLINREYTRRGIPPVFRNLPDLNDDDPDQFADLFAIDLEWLAVRYPTHAPLFSRWRGIFKSTTFHSTADYIATNHPRRAMHWFCKGLSLTEDQQRELHAIKRDGIRHELNRLRAQQEEVRVTLAAKYHARDSRHKTDDHVATIAHRLHIWFCGSLAAWRPQRTAGFYEALTGENITRQRADKTIAQVHRDVPESRPKRSRKARK